MLYMPLCCKRCGERGQQCYLVIVHFSWAACSGWSAMGRVLKGALDHLAFCALRKMLCDVCRLAMPAPFESVCWSSLAAMRCTCCKHLVAASLETLGRCCLLYWLCLSPQRGFTEASQAWELVAFSKVSSIYLLVLDA